MTKCRFGTDLTGARTRGYNYLLQMKRSEVARYNAAIAEKPPPEGQNISEWEMREYFEFY